MKNRNNNITFILNFAATNESSFDILMQYTEIKQRLTVIEDTLKTITNHFGDNDKTQSQAMQPKALNANNKPNNSGTNESVFSLIANKTNSRTDLGSLLTSTNVLVALGAWLIGLLSALFSYMLLFKSVNGKWMNKIRGYCFCLFFFAFLWMKIFHIF